MRYSVLRLPPIIPLSDDNFSEAKRPLGVCLATFLLRISLSFKLLWYVYSFKLSDMPDHLRNPGINKEKMDKETSLSRHCMKDDYYIDIHLHTCQLQGRETKQRYILTQK